MDRRPSCVRKCCPLPVGPVTSPTRPPHRRRQWRRRRGNNNNNNSNNSINITSPHLPLHRHRSSRRRRRRITSNHPSLPNDPIANLIHETHPSPVALMVYPSLPPLVSSINISNDNAMVVRSRPISLGRSKVLGIHPTMPPLVTRAAWVVTRPWLDTALPPRRRRSDPVVAATFLLRPILVPIVVFPFPAA